MVQTVIIEPVERSREDHSRYGYHLYLDGEDIADKVQSATIDL